MDWWIFAPTASFVVCFLLASWATRGFPTTWLGRWWRR